MVLEPTRGKVNKNFLSLLLVWVRTELKYRSSTIKMCEE